MDPDELEFKRTMELMGVSPMEDGFATPKAETFEEDDESEDARLFRRFVEKGYDEEEERNLFLSALDSGVIPNKDDRSESEASRLRKLKSVREKGLSLEDSLDLHGMTGDEAVAALAGFVARAFAHSLKTVVVITGKGKHSKTGVSVLRPRVEQWIRRKGGRFIDKYAEAPRAYGGGGAFILYLKNS